MTTSEALAAFSEDDLTCKLLRGIYTVVPYSPEFPHYASVDDAVRALRPDADQGVYMRARDIAASSSDLADVLWMADLIDKGDTGYAIATGLWSALRWYQGKEDALDTDVQQRNDAVLKAIALSYMIYKAFPGGLADKASAFRTTPSGQAIGLYYGCVEVALPFADNAAMGTGNMVSNLLDGGASAQLSRLGQLAGGRNLDGASEMLSTLTEPLQRIVTHARGYIDPVVNSVKPYVPGVMNAADKTAGVVANAADVMPVYRLLGARLAAESAALRALEP